MKGSRLAGVFLLALVLLTAPAAVQACPAGEKPTVAVVVDSAELIDADGDGVKGDVLVTGRVIVGTSGGSYLAPCMMVFRVRYTTNPELFPNTWLYHKVFVGFAASQEGASNTFTYVIKGLPYPGWYRLTAAAFYRGAVGVSQPFDFDPPGGSPGPIGN